MLPWRDPLATWGKGVAASSLLCWFHSAVSCPGPTLHTQSPGWAQRFAGLPVCWPLPWGGAAARPQRASTGDTARNCGPCSVSGQLGLQAWPEGPRSLWGVGAAEGAQGSAGGERLRSLLV